MCYNKVSKEMRYKKMKKTITTIIVILALVAITLTTFASCSAEDDYTEISYTEGFEVSSLNLDRSKMGYVRYYAGLRNDNNAVVIEIDEELFASLTVGDVVTAEVLGKNGNGVKVLTLSNIEIYNE